MSKQKEQSAIEKLAVPVEMIERRIFLIRGQKVMLSTHLADLYNVAPRVLVQAVKRNIERFPEDFMFQLTKNEFENLKSQFVTSSWGGLRRATPYAFTEQGVAMLSSVLNSKRAIQINIAIMRAFVKLRELLATSPCKIPPHFPQAGAFFRGAINYDRRSTRHSAPLAPTL